MSSGDTCTILAMTYAESSAMVEDLAEKSLANVYTSLLPPIFSKQDIITCLQKLKKVCDRLDKKLACLTLLTDHVVAAIANPFLVDIFQQDTTNRSKKYVMNIVSMGWVSLFQAIQNSLPMNKPSKEAMEATLSFLRRMDHLLQPCDMRMSSLRLTSVSDPCFWSSGLQAIDGRKAPVKSVSRIEKMLASGFPQDSGLDAIFEVTEDVISSSAKGGVQTITVNQQPQPIVSAPPQAQPQVIQLQPQQMTNTVAPPPGGIQIVQQIIGPNGEIQQIPIQLNTQQLQLIRSQMMGQASQPIVIQTAPIQAHVSSPQAQMQQVYIQQE